MEVVESGEIATDINQVLDRWKNYFKGICKNVGSGQFDEEHLAFITHRVGEMEQEYENLLKHNGVREDRPPGNEVLNQPLTYEEV